MAPAQKRGAAQAGEAKKQRVDPTLKAVMEGLKMSDGTEAAKGLLLATLPHIGLATDERHSSQEAVMRMIEDALAGVEAKLTTASDEEVAKVQTFEEKQQTLKAAVEEAKAACLVAKEAKDAKQKAVEEAQVHAKETKAVLQEKVKMQKDGDQDFDRVTSKKKEVDTCVGEHFAAIEAGTAEDLKPHFEALQPLLAELPLEDSLKGALPSTCTKGKAERGGFDSMVLQQLGLQLKERAEKIAAELAELEPAAAERAKEVQVAQAASDGAVAADEKATEELTAAMEAHATAKEAVRVAEGALVAYEPEYTEATVVRDQKAMDLDNFKVHTMGCYEILKSGTPQANTGGA